MTVWYHGKMSRALCLATLQSPSSRKGDFLVRESGSQDGFLCLSVRDNQRQDTGGLAHLIISGRPGAWVRFDQADLRCAFLDRLAAWQLDRLTTGRSPLAPNVAPNPELARCHRRGTDLNPRFAGVAPLWPSLACGRAQRSRTWWTRCRPVAWPNALPLLQLEVRLQRGRCLSSTALAESGLTAMPSVESSLAFPFTSRFFGGTSLPANGTKLVSCGNCSAVLVNVESIFCQDCGCRVQNSPEEIAVSHVTFC